MVCWSHRIREKSLKHFVSNGFKVLAASYCDERTLQTSHEWAQSADNYQDDVVGFMYTTWNGQYGLLGDFGDMVKNVERGLE